MMLKAFLLLLAFLTIACVEDEIVDEGFAVYDAVIVGGGIAGLTTAYMLRDKNILLLERTNRVGGRVVTERIQGSINNLGTQFFMEDRTSFLDVVDELGVPRISVADSDNFLLYLEGVLHEDFYSLLSPRFFVDSIRLYLHASRTNALFYGLSLDDPRWQELVSRNTSEDLQGYVPTLSCLFNAYLAAFGLPESTSAGVGVALMLGLFRPSHMVVAKEGFQSITDAMADAIGRDRIITNAEVVRVEQSNEEEEDTKMTVRYESHIMTTADSSVSVVRSKDVVLAVLATDVLDMDIVPELPDWKKRALQGIEYSQLMVVTIVLDRHIPWDRFGGMIADRRHVIFSCVADITYGLEKNDPVSTNTGPIIYNFFIAIFPGEVDTDAYNLMTKKDDADEEIISVVLADFIRAVPQASSIRDHVLTEFTKVTRFTQAEIEPSPHYFTDLLPFLPTPVGHIHFGGDYTDTRVFVDGAVYSGFRVARELGSSLVHSEEVKDPKSSNLFAMFVAGVGLLVLVVCLIWYCCWRLGCCCENRQKKVKNQ